MQTDTLSKPKMNRRQFLTLGGTTLAGLSLASALPFAARGSENTARNEGASSLSESDFYTLPSLPYAYDALEPHIDTETMRLHHDIHFAGYTKGLNQALEKLASARVEDDYTLIAHWENQLAFNGAGYVLHTVFFENMAPAGSTAPGADLQKVVSKHFGSFEAFKKHFSAAAQKVQGSGWGILGFQPLGRRLIVLQAEKHQNLTQWGVIPLLSLDVWEHAYYLKYQNRRGDYIQNWWNVVDWNKLEAGLNTVLAAYPEDTVAAGEPA